MPGADIEEQPGLNWHSATIKGVQELFVCSEAIESQGLKAFAVRKEKFDNTIRYSCAQTIKKLMAAEKVETKTPVTRQVELWASTREAFVAEASEVFAKQSKEANTIASLHSVTKNAHNNKRRTRQHIQL